MLLRQILETKLQMGDEDTEQSNQYVPLPNPSQAKSKKKGRKTWPDTDTVNNSLINNIWFMNNSDAA